MNKYNSLLLHIAEKYHIKRGNNESDIEWKVRIIYSICGLMAYSSLWDNIDEEPVSIAHLKQRVRNVHNSYLELFPEISSCFGSELGEEIADIYLKSGIAYHRPNRIVPSRERCSCVGNICFQRGINIDNIERVSGLGFFSQNTSVENGLLISQMFNLCEKKLLDYWKELLDNANWVRAEEFRSDVEYLKMEYPFTRGYWTDNPYKNGQESLLRTVFLGSKLYYLYRFRNGIFEISPLPDWMVSEYQYRYIASACLHSIDMLPSIDYTIDDDLIHMHFNYLLPPRELNWIKLFTWPENCNTFPNDFYRKCSFEVFNAFVKTLSEKGYSFIVR